MSAGLPHRREFTDRHHYRGTRYSNGSTAHSDSRVIAFNSAGQLIMGRCGIYLKPVRKTLRVSGKDEQYFAGGFGRGAV